MPRIARIATLAVTALAIGFAGGRLTVPADPSANAWSERPSQGPADAPVVLVEYTDYQCPFCRRYHDETYTAILAEYGDRIRYVVRHFPLENIHPNARGAARGAVCALRQNRFWDFHDALFDSGAGGLAREGLIGHALELGLDVEAFRACLESEASADVVAGDFVDGVSRGVRATPAFFVNDRKIDGSQPIDTFRAVLDEALAESGGP
jgi:protein-disulfide isomerase